MRVAFFLMLAVAVHAKEPTQAVQRQLQESLRQFIVAFNDGDLDGAVRQVHPEFTWRGQSAGYTLSWAWRNWRSSPKNLPGFQVTALARDVQMLTDDVALGDGFFRTVGSERGEYAGPLTVLWLRTGPAWKLATLRFGRVSSDPPFINIEPAGQHDPQGPDGWVSLLEGSRLMAVPDGDLPDSWTLAGGVLAATAVSPGRSVRTRDTYRSFELQFEWKVPPKGNSGVKYSMLFLNLTFGGRGSDGVGSEYQVVDDAGDPGAISHAEERSGALYSQIAPRDAMVRPVGEFNQSRIVVRGRHCEHWLNGVKVVEYEAETAPLESPLLFQHHGTAVWYRNVKVRRLD